MRVRQRAGGVFSAVAFMVIGAVSTLLLGIGTGSDADPERAAADAVDIGFSQDMIVHHHQAVTMAQTVRDRVSPPVRQLASGIELNQLKEIGQMQGWLALWNAPQVSAGEPMAWMNEGKRGHGGHAAPAGGAMPGLASLAEMDRLGEAKGKDADVRFLQLMIRHHEGGLQMTVVAAQKADHPQVRALATLMAAEQRQETATMTGLLSALGGRPLT